MYSRLLYSLFTMLETPNSGIIGLLSLRESSMRAEERVASMKARLKRGSFRVSKMATKLDEHHNELFVFSAADM